MTFDLAKAEGRRALLAWFVAETFEHRHLIEITGVSNATMQNWANRRLVEPLDLPDVARRRYSARMLIDVAIAAQLVDLGLTPAASFEAAFAATEQTLRLRDGPSEKMSRLSSDFRDFFALVHTGIQEAPPHRKTIFVRVGPFKEILKNIAIAPAYLLVAIGRLWFDAALKAFELKQAEAIGDDRKQRRA
jgi:hypothetical protein